MVANFQDRGLPDALAVSVTFIFGVTSAASIVPVGLILERIHVRIGAMVQAVLVLLSMLLLQVADNYPMLIAFGLVFGIGAGMRNVVEVLLVANYFGRGSLGAIKGYTAPFRAVSPVGAVLAGVLFDKTGSYSLAFWLFAGVAVVMFILMIFARQPIKPVEAAATDG
jgi:MFS family permease